MVFEDTALEIIPKIGEGVSWLTQRIIQTLSNWGVGLTLLQSKIITLLLIGGFIYIIVSVISITKKPLKWGLLIGLIFLMTSVFISLITG